MTVALSDGTVSLPIDSSGVNYPDGGAPLSPPSISSHSGTLVQDATITLTGGFTAERSGQLLFLTGNPALNGTCATEFVPINGGALNPASPDCWKHATDQSFSGSGASIKFTKAAGNAIEGAHNSKFLLPERAREIYYSYTSRVVMTDWTSQSGGQIKMGRLSTVENSHSFEPVFGHTDIRNGSATAIQYYSTLPTYTNMKYSDGTTNVLAEDTFGKWTRHEEWVKLPDYPSKNQATVGFWAGGLICDDEEIFRLQGAPEEIALITETPDENWEYSWQEYTIDKVLIPFYVRSWMDCVVHDDCIYINDSPERVELGNSPVLHECTKKVVQEQLSRSASSIQFKARLGNLLTSDNIYAFVVNSDGQYSSGRLIRSAA